MRNYIDAASIAGTVRMTRSQFAGAFAIVEGDTDARVYSRFFGEEVCMTLPAMGKANAAGALRILEEQSMDGVFAIVDADFWRMSGNTPDSENMFLTDTHDLETMILASTAFDKVCQEFVDKKRFDSACETMRDVLFAVGVPLGLFRWIASEQPGAVALKGKRIAFERFVSVSGATVQVDTRAMVEAVVENGRSDREELEDITGRISALLSDDQTYDPWQVCRGHDLVDILTFLLRHGFGNHRAKRLNRELVDGMLRISYGYRQFAATHLHEDIRNWESRNTTFPVLPEQ